MYVEDLAIAKGHNATEPTIYPTKTPTKPPMWKAKNWCGDIFWYETGTTIGICPARDPAYTFFVYAIIRPYYNANNQLIGVEPGDEHSIARYIAGELIESVNPQLGLTWKNDSISQWALKRQHVAWQEAISNSGRPKTNWYW